MHVAALSLTDYRNYESAEVEFSAGATVLVGRNGQGKTNLVEAIGFLATLGSHRVSSDAALVRAGASAAFVRARLQHSERTLLVEFQINREGANKVLVNRSPSKTREIPRLVHSVLFAPEDLQLVRGDPGVRRRWIDEILLARSPRIQSVLADYERVVRQRTSLLKSARANRVPESALSTLDIWDERLTMLGAEIISERIRTLRDITPFLRDAYRGIAGEDHGPTLEVALSYLEGGPISLDEATDDPAKIADGISFALKEARPKELERAQCLIGPHRDDVHYVLNDLPAKGYASHGESWSFALSLQLATAELLRRDSLVGDPILVLDDVFAELDAARRQRLATAIEGFEQVLITAAVLGDVPEELRERILFIRRGRIVTEQEAFDDND